MQQTVLYTCQQLEVERVFSYVFPLEVGTSKNFCVIHRFHMVSPPLRHLFGFRQLVLQGHDSALQAADDLGTQPP